MSLCISTKANIIRIGLDRINKDVQDIVFDKYQFRTIRNNGTVFFHFQTIIILFINIWLETSLSRKSRETCQFLLGYVHPNHRNG